MLKYYSKHVLGQIHALFNSWTNFVWFQMEAL
jgi:hypothetical protein